MAFEASISWDSGEDPCQTGHEPPSYVWISRLLLLVRWHYNLIGSMHDGLTCTPENPLTSFLCPFSIA